MTCPVFLCRGLKPGLDNLVPPGMGAVTVPGFRLVKYDNRNHKEILVRRTTDGLRTAEVAVEFCGTS
jgi:hypothetical protein